MVDRSSARDGSPGMGRAPMAAALGAAWIGRQQNEIGGDGAWRTAGDGVEGLEALARRLVAGTQAPAKRWQRTQAVLDWIENTLRPAVAACGDAEIGGLLRGLAGRFVPPGPSGAPTRGRPEVLPTGRNFYSLDTRVVPTPAAWQLGWESAQLLVARHAQDHGSYPRRLPLSAL